MTNIQNRLKERLDIDFPESLLDNAKIRKKVQILYNLITTVDGDSDEKRLAYKLLCLSSQSDEATLQCFLNNVSYFKTCDKLDRVFFCLNAALVGSTQLCESLFTEKCNPKVNVYILAYTLCSGKLDWTLKLIEKWKVDIFNSKYCFNISCARLGISALDLTKRLLDSKNASISICISDALEQQQLDIKQGYLY